MKTGICPSCGNEGPIEEGCPSCPGFWYDIIDLGAILEQPTDEETMIKCPFCGAWHPDDVLCGCDGEKAEAMRIWDKIDRGRSITNAENGFLCLWEGL